MRLLQNTHRAICCEIIGACTLLVLTIGSAVPSSAAGGPRDEWPCFHGPRRDNKSTETGLLKKWPAGGPKLLWTASGLGKGYSTVSIAGGMIYTAGMIDKQTHVFAFDLDGRQKWRRPNGRSWAATMPHAITYDGARGTPTADGKRVYHLSEGGRLAAFDGKTGEEIWNLNVLRQFGGQTPKYGLAESVLIDGDRLICSPAGTKGYMVCLDKSTGKLMWANAEVRGTAGYCSAAIAAPGGRRQVVSMSSSEVFGVDAKTGKLLWSVEHGNHRDNNATDPIFHKGHVFAASPYGKGSMVARLSTGRDEITAEKVWASSLMDNHHGGVVLVDGFLYGAGHEAGGWFCLDFMTGKPAWRAKGKGSLTWADGMLYCMEERGTMALVRATPERHQVVSSFALPTGGRGLYWAHPVVCGGRLYVRHADRLFAYDIRAK